MKVIVYYLNIIDGKNILEKDYPAFLNIRDVTFDIARELNVDPYTFTFKGLNVDYFLNTRLDELKQIAQITFTYKHHRCRTIIDCKNN